MGKGAPTVVGTKKLFGWPVVTISPPVMVLRRGKPYIRIEVCNKKPIDDNTLLIIAVGSKRALFIVMPLTC